MPAYCGSVFYSNLNPGDACPNGNPATYSPNGANEAGAMSAMGEASSLTPTVPWNVNTTPVKIKVKPGGTYSGGIPVGEVESTIPFYEAQDVANELRGKGGKEYETFVNDLRRYTGSELGTVNGVNDAWNTVLTDAYSAGVNAMDLLKRGPSLISKETPGATPGSPGSRAYAGPRTTVTMASERDLRTTADAVASTVLGRAVTDEEFQSVLEQVRSAEKAEPTITTSGVGSTVTQSGLTAEGRQNIITEALMQGPEAEEFGKATKMMDLFYSALEARPEGA